MGIMLILDEWLPARWMPDAGQQVQLRVAWCKERMVTAAALMVYGWVSSSRDICLSTVIDNQIHINLQQYMRILERAQSTET